MLDRYASVIVNRLCWLCIVIEEIFGMKRKMMKWEMRLFWFWWFMGLVCAGCVMCLKKFMGWEGRWRRGRWDYFGFGLGFCSCVLFWFGFGLCWACDIEGDGDERRESVDRVFLGKEKEISRWEFFIIGF